MIVTSDNKSFISIEEYNRLQAENKEIKNLSSARRHWWDNAREREKKLQAENERLNNLLFAYESVRAPKGESNE